MGLVGSGTKNDKQAEVKLDRLLSIEYEAVEKWASTCIDKFDFKKIIKQKGESIRNGNAFIYIIPAKNFKSMHLDDPRKILEAYLFLSEKGFVKDFLKRASNYFNKVELSYKPKVNPQSIVLVLQGLKQQ